MYRNGARIPGTQITRVPPLRGGLGKAETPKAESCAAELGRPMPSLADPPSELRVQQLFGLVAWVSEWL